MVTVRIEGLPGEVEAAVSRIAAARGQCLEDYLRDVLIREASLGADRRHPEADVLPAR